MSPAGRAGAGKPSAGKPGAGKPGRAAGGGGWTKSGKPRPGTGGHGKRRLEGKGPTPPAYLRPGHPAQRRATAAARDQDRADPGSGSAPADRPGGRSSAGQSGRGTAGRSAEPPTG